MPLCLVSTQCTLHAKVKNSLKPCVIIQSSPSQSYRASPVIWDHRDTCCPTQVNVPHLNTSPATWWMVSKWSVHFNDSTYPKSSAMCKKRI